MTACDCWGNSYALGHDGHCCFLHDDRRTWRDDGEECHIPTTPTDTGGRNA